MPFNQQMTVPVELALADGEPGRAGLSLTAWPVEELLHLREEKPAFEVEPGTPRAVAEALTLADGLDAFDLGLWVDPGKATGFTIDLRGTKLTYDAAKGTVTCKGVTAPVKTVKGVAGMRVLVDRGSVEVFTDDAIISVAAIPDEKNRKAVLTPAGGGVSILRGGVWRMKSAWEK
jgi:fructan beta-fructosidase